MSTFSCDTGGAFVYGSYIKAARCLHKKSCAMNLKVLLNHKKGKFTCLIDKKKVTRQRKRKEENMEPLADRWRVKIKGSCASSVSFKSR